MRLTETERIAKRILENAGWTVVKPSWPDFLIYTPTNPSSYCFVEVKSKVHEHVDKNQLKTWRLLKKLGFPFYLFAVEEETTARKLDRVAKSALWKYII